VGFSAAVARSSLHLYELLKILLTTAVFASRLDSISAFPYTFMVVETWVCRISFCWTQMGAPVSSSHERYVRRKVCQPMCPSFPAVSQCSL
jgi:hypothetical protein